MKNSKLYIPIILFFLFSCNKDKKTKINFDNKIEITKTDTTDVINIGISAMLSPMEALPAYEEIIKYIGKKLNKKTKMIFAKDYATMNNLVHKQSVFAAFVCSGAYVIAHQKWNMELIVAPALHGKHQYFSYIIVNKKSPIKNFIELKDKKFAYTDPQSNTGRLVPEYQLSTFGETSKSFFSSIVYSGSHDNSIEAVARNIVDGAAVDNLIWEYSNKTDSTFTSKTKIIDQFGPFCTPPFVTNPKADSTLKHKIKLILIDMDKDPQGKIILKKLLIDKFDTIKDSCYQSVRQMSQKVMMK